MGPHSDPVLSALEAAFVADLDRVIGGAALYSFVMVTVLVADPE